MHFDSTIRVGYYSVLGSPAAEHTYATIDHRNELWAFPCFGGAVVSAGERGAVGVNYPAPLWTPYMIGSRDVGKELPANLYVALGLAQFTTNPSYNFRLEAWRRYWDGGAIDGFASHSGITYAVDGLCQQACNRVLWSSRTSDFLNCPVNWPPSFSATYWTYGYYGKITEPVAVALAAQLVAAAALRVRHPGLLVGFDTADALSDVVLEDTPAGVAEPGEFSEEAGVRIGAALRNGVDRDVRRAEIVSLLKSAPRGEAVTARPVTLGGVAEADRRFQAAKRDLDTQLLRREIGPEQYAAEVNARFHVMLAELRDAMPADTFASLFPEVVRSPNYQLVDPALMPPSYDPVQERALL